MEYTFEPESLEYTIDFGLPLEPAPSWPARLFAGISFVYAFAVAMGLLLTHSFYSAQPDSVRLWMLLPTLGSLFTLTAVIAALPPLRVWVWAVILACMFFCWIAAFSSGRTSFPSRSYCSSPS